MEIHLRHPRSPFLPLPNLSQWLPYWIPSSSTVGGASIFPGLMEAPGGFGLLVQTSLAGVQDFALWCKSCVIRWCRPLPPSPHLIQHFEPLLSAQFPWGPWGGSSL